ncbi:MAG TPA: SDR family NAD(P)-dependent oxidoreductase [Sandaracinaceae bacterium LLY-WYZ-13_1]|nr:SDR family NAD(P)-dependent oxidoreductase [Sandaracinaceae bacterium LLY-WYZ-13_1]
MDKALVTGGCGFLGSWIVRQLVDDGVDVRVFAVPGESRENLPGLDVELVEGDVRNPDDVTKAVEGVDTVFHAAAVYQDFAPDPTLMYDVNLRGTFHVLEAARRADVEKVIYTASIVSVGRPAPGRTGDEQTAYEAWDIDFAYSRSKFFSREMAEFFAEWGMDVRVVCPGVVLGPGDLRPTPSGELIVKSFTQPGPPVYFDGGANYVDVRDAARVHLLAAEKGGRGERYLATHANLTNGELVDTIERVSGRNRRAIKLPLPVARGIAIAMDKRARSTGEPPLLAKEFFEYSLRPAFYRNDKARRELGATFRPIEETIADAIAYFRERGLIEA